MDPVRNPFAPSSGSQPPELAGRDEIISNAGIALQRVLRGKHEKSQIFLGPGGTGTTVLLNKIEQLAQSHGHLTSFVEASDDKRLKDLLYPKIHQVLRKLSMIESAKAAAHSTIRALRAVAGAFRISAGGVSLSVDSEAGTADSGILEFDLRDLFIRIGEAAQSADKAWTLLIDELQYLSKVELSALIVAIHRVNQRKLPVMFFGAGLPQIAALAGDATSYAERLFDFSPIGLLDKSAAISAIRQPIHDEGEAISYESLEMIIAQTEGYPYFLQEWGYQAWNIADASPINVDDVKKASAAVLRRLDEGFFRCPFTGLKPPLFKRSCMFESHAENAQFEQGGFKSPLLKTYGRRSVVV